jgi:DNA-directed RNA polymerase subunit M/transcription elongation factor TFIIS
MAVFSFDLKPGKWYILITCKQCKTRHVLFPDLSEGRATINATYRWTCPSCSYQADYDSEDLERHHHKSEPEPGLERKGTD